MTGERRRISRAWLLFLFVGGVVAVVLIGAVHLKVEPGAPRPPSLAEALTLCTTILAAAYFPITLTPLHPIAAAGYREFLQSVAWSPGDPLLRGPAHPVWTDFLVALVLIGAAALLGSPWHAAVVWLVLSVSFAATAACLMLGCRLWSGFALLALALAAGLVPVIENEVWDEGGVYSLTLSLAGTGPLIFWGRAAYFGRSRAFPGTTNKGKRRLRGPPGWAPPTTASRRSKSASRLALPVASPLPPCLQQS